MAASSRSVPRSSMMAEKRAWCSGRWRQKASIMLLTFQMKMPAFQKNSPHCTNVCASSRLGFSVKHLTRLMTSLFDFWIYPYPVSGRLGLMPTVIRASWRSANSRHSRMMAWKSVSLRMRWSAGVTIISASGLILRSV